MNMAVHRLDSVIRTIRRSTHHDADALSDGHLLDQFIEHRNEIAFATLVRRHGPMVWGVCRRIVAHHQDAEDAFQAAFLVLARSAASVRPRDLVANWLFGVAQRTALKARATAAKRQARERLVVALPDAAIEAGADDGLRQLIDGELARLPDIYREAIVLCDLEGWTGNDAARHLKIPEGTLATRLRTARKMLAQRLTRQGVALTGAAAAVLFAQKAPAAPLVSKTVEGASSMIAGKLTGISANVLAYVEGVMKSMAITKLKQTLATMLLLGAMFAGGGLISCYAVAGQQAGQESNVRQPPPTAASQAKNQGVPRIHEKGEFPKVTYPVAELVIPIPGVDPKDENARRTKEDWLIRKITQTVAPNSWQQNGGKGTIQYFPMGHALVIDNSLPVQDQVRNLLQTMRRFQDVQVACEMQIVSIPEERFDTLKGLLPQLKMDRHAILNAAETFALLRKAEEDKRTVLTRAPKSTLFLGQSAVFGLNSSKEQKSTFELNALVAANLHHVHLSVKATIDKITFNATDRIEDGMTLVQVKYAKDGCRMLLVTPRVIICSEVSELSPPPKKRASD
ncbi:MAG TPA: RNA polymerase sigma factor [Gemmataceae bacterium]|nr:RNA polymerase sigma factor [Gemmataceae bacterium]